MNNRLRQSPHAPSPLSLSCCRRILLALGLVAFCLAPCGCDETSDLARRPAPAETLATTETPAPTATATTLSTATDTPTESPTATVTATVTATASPEPTPANTATPSALAAIEPPEGWVAYRGVSNEFLFYHPPEWRIDERMQNGVRLSVIGRQQMTIMVFDFDFLAAFDDDNEVDPLFGPGAGDQDPAADVQLIVSEYRGRPRPMHFSEMRMENPTFGTTDHVVTVYSDLDGGGSVMADMGIVDGTLTPEEIDTFITVVATLRPTLETYEQVYVFPRDLEDPVRWTRHSGGNYRLKHPSSWEIAEEWEDGLSLYVPEFGSATIIVSDRPADPGMVGDDKAIADLLSTTPASRLTLGEIEILSQGSLDTPLPCNYVELRQLQPDSGARGHLFIFQAPLGKTGVVTGVLDRTIGMLAPEEQAAFLEILRTVEHRPSSNL